MRNVRKATGLAVMRTFVGIWVVLAVGGMVVWLIGEARVFGLVVLSTAIVATLLVLYFDWREKLLWRMLSERRDHRKAA